MYLCECTKGPEVYVCACVQYIYVSQKYNVYISVDVQLGMYMYKRDQKLMYEHVSCSAHCKVYNVS